MKKPCHLLIIMCIVCLLFGCGKNSNTTKSSPSTNKEEISKTQSPLTEISKKYKNGTLTLELENGLNEETFNSIIQKYSDYLSELANYITKHTDELNNGKTFQDFDDYEDAFKDFYEWANGLIYFNGPVDEDYQPLWEKFKNLLKRHLQVLDETYSEDWKSAQKILTDFTNDCTAEAYALIDLIPEKKIHSGELIKSDGFAELTIKQVSYQTRINPSKTDTVYTYYEVQNSDNVYLACNFDLTNLQSTAVYDLDDLINFQVTYEGGYNYSGWAIAEDSGRLTPYPNLLPLTSYNTWYLIEVPAKLQNTPYTLTLTMNGETYTFEN